MKYLKSFLKNYAYFYAGTAIVTWVLASIIVNRFGLNAVNIRFVFLGGIIIAALLANALIIYKANWGNGVGNVIVAYLVSAPIPVVVRYMYQMYVFRVVWILFAVIGAYVFIYTLIVLAMRMRNNELKKQLNELLDDKKNKEK
jgi:hypothetical protein